MAEAVLEVVLENLNSLIQKELGVVLGFNQDMKRLASLFSAIKATLEDAAEKQFSDNSIKKRGFHLAELGPLQLKGDLHIKNMGKVKSIEDAREANMSSKKLNQLSLSWDRNEESELQENVEEIIEVLQPNTQQLQSLGVVGYKGAHFPQWMSSPSLKQLVIKGCRNLNVSAGFQCLEDLWIEGCREVKGLHVSLQQMTCLKSLRLESLPNLKSLPDCFGNLPLLRKLSICYCSKLMCLPRSLSLSSLERLEIYGCPELEKRCEKEKGEDWPKIAHIPVILF